MKLVDVSPHTIAKFVAWLADEREQGKRLSHSTIANAVIPIRAMYGTAVAEGLVRHDPTARLKLPPRETHVDEDETAKALSREQLRRLLEIAPERYRLLLGLLVSTGLRISEAIALQWKHVDQGAEPAIQIKRAMVRGRIERPKSRHGIRTVPIPPTLAEALADARARAENPGEDGLVFTSQRGTPLDPDNLRRRMLVPLLAKVGVDAGGWHLLRHTFASIRLADGQSVVQVSRMLGHHSPGFTLSVYSHVLDGEHAPALDLGVALQSPEEAIEGDATDVDEPTLLAA